jgi:hypothetical protein
MCKNSFAQFRAVQIARIRLCKVAFGCHTNVKSVSVHKFGPNLSYKGKMSQNFLWIGSFNCIKLFMRLSFKCMITVSDLVTFLYFKN